MDSSNNTQQACPLCLRSVALIFHQLIPRKMHRRAHFKKNYTKEELNEGVYICRLCHRALHKQFDEMALAKSMNTVELVRADESIIKLREEGFTIDRHRTKTLMRKLDLKVTQRLAYKVTTKRKHSDRVVDNLLNQNFNPVGPNQVLAGDMTYLKTGEGWMYLDIVMNLYSRRIIGWEIYKRMTTGLVEQALLRVIKFRRPKRGAVFHSDRGSQCTSLRFRKLLTKKGVRPSMGNCWCVLGQCGR